MPLLEVQQLSKVFERDGRSVTAIEDFSLVAEPGEFISIVGPSGCGKSTFLHILAGFEPISDGSILLQGRPVGGPGPDRGMMFQDYSLFPWLTVGRNVSWPLEIKKVPAAARNRIVEKQLAMVGLSGFRNNYPAELSGGMKQRTALARLLALDPEIMLLDEPFGSLDAQTREEMQEQLHQIWMQQRKTVLFVTHDIDEAVFLGTRVIVFTARPGGVKADVDIDLPEDRTLELKKDSSYHEYRNRIWDLLRDEVKRARLEMEAQAAAS